MGEYERREDIKRLAALIADTLFADAKAGKLTKIGIDEIRNAIAAFVTVPLDPEAAEMLEEMTTRRVVERVG